MAENGDAVALAAPEEAIPRPSQALPGERHGSVVYADGGGYFYHAEKVRSNRRFLRCANKEKGHCLARASMGLEAGAPIHVTPKRPYHNHQPNATKGTKLVMMARLKERATQEVETRVSQILNEEAVRDPETVCNIAAPDARLAMKRARGAAQPAIPRTLLDDERNEMFQPGRENSRMAENGDAVALAAPEEAIPRPSQALPGKRHGSVVYADGGGYFYHVEKVRSNRRFLRCANKEKGHCLARASMGLEAGAPIHVTPKRLSHNHQPDATKGTKLVMMARLKERATQEVETRVSQILNEEAVRDPETVCNIAAPDLRLAMKRARGAAQPAIPRTLLDDMRNEMFHPGRENLRMAENGDAVAQAALEEAIPRPSQSLPGKRHGSVVYADGGGYFYHAEKVRSNRRFLRCANKEKGHCLARASMGLEAGAPIHVTPKRPSHNHQPDATKGTKLVMMARLKERATQEVETRVSQILNEEAVRDPETVCNIAAPDARLAMKRARGAAQPAIPRTLLDDERNEMFQPGRENLRMAENGDAVAQAALEEAIPRPSQSLPGKRHGSVVYADGGGYFYHAEKVRSNRRFMRCANKEKGHCLARASMGLEAGAPIHVTPKRPSHNHQPDATKGTKLVMMARLKERATQEVETRVSQILNEEAVRDPETVCNIAAPNARLAMKRARGAAQPAIPRTLLDDERNEMIQPGRENLRFTLDGLEQFISSSTDPPLVEGKLRLYSMRFCPYAARVHFVLDAKKIPYDVVYINLIKKPEWYTNRIPTGKVPALVVDGTDLYESLIIANYLNEKYPENPLHSEDPLQKAKDLILIENFGKVTSSMYKLFFSEVTTETFNQCLETLDEYEKELSTRGSTFFGGSAVKMVDYMIWPWFERMTVFALPDKPQFKLPEARFPCLTKWTSAMMEDGAVKKHYLRPEQFAHHLNMRKAGTPDYVLI